MSEYHKIDTIFKRDLETKHKNLIIGDWSHEAFEYLANNEWVFTEKVDGTNIRIMLGDARIGESYLKFGGRTDNAMIPAKLVSYLEDKFFPMKDSLLAHFVKGAVLYGEGYGAGIQRGGGNYRADSSFVLFDIQIDGWWLNRSLVEELAAQFSIDIVPVIGRGTLHDLVNFVKPGFESKWGKFESEGIVARPSVELKTRAGHRIITKLKCRDFK